MKKNATAQSANFPTTALEGVPRWKYFSPLGFQMLICMTIICGETLKDYSLFEQPTFFARIISIFEEKLLRKELQCVYKNISNRCQVCLEAGGWHFKTHLWTKVSWNAG